ncbi:MAG: thiamine pyrophosphate-dependent enzyme [Pseudomonadota bacterium]
MVSGIGCSASISGYVDFHSLHTLHGRALAFATGVKLSRPGLKVIVPMGDGDALAIGGNHFIHAARRNMDLTVVCVNNFNYGMTGGQAAATTPHLARTTTTPMGNPEMPFNLPLLAWASGATYVARWTILHARDLAESIEEALQRRGFSFIEVLSPCPVNYGRRNKMKPMDTLRIFKEKTLIKNNAQPTELGIDFERGIVLGKFVDEDKPSCGELYDKTCRPSLTQGTAA